MQPSLVIMLMRMYSAGYQEVYPYHFLNGKTDIVWKATLLLYSSWLVIFFASVLKGEL